MHGLYPFPAGVQDPRPVSEQRRHRVEARVRRRHAVYRCYAEDDRLLYIGRSPRPRDRVLAHRRVHPWSHEIVRWTEEWFDGHLEAHIAEYAAIRAENPIHNRQGKP